MEPQAVKRALIISALLAQLVLAETPQPTHTEPVLPIQPTLEKEVVLEGNWRETGQARLVFRSREDSSEVENIQLQSRLTGPTWFVALECEGLDQLGVLSFKAQKDLFFSTRGFAEWRMVEGNQELAAGVETALFGEDKLRLKRATSLTVEVDPVTQMDYEIPLPFQTRIGLSGIHQGERNELTGQIRQNCGRGWEWGAGVKTELLNGEQLAPPEIQGNLRWTW